MSSFSPRVSRTGRALGLLVAATLALGACAGDSGGSGGSGGGATTKGSAQDHNAADVTFAKQMIPHHAQALQMADLALKKTTTLEVGKFAEQIQAAQVPEIETMTGWLQSWKEEVPKTSRDHGSAHGGGGEQATGPGMMSHEEMLLLEAAPRGPAFDRRWLEMMVRHHEGAIAMARTQQSNGQFGPAKELAAKIQADQTREIAAMRRLLPTS
jgi:uncharacterized protein (DUF305 family)